MTAIFVDQAIEALRADFRGELVAPGSPGYDEARRVRNGLIDRHPALIARCTRRRRRRRGGQLRPRARPPAVGPRRRAQRRRDRHQRRRARDRPLGRCAASASIRPRAPSASRAAPPGATSTARPSSSGWPRRAAIVSTTGVGGLTLHGGWGWLRRKYGYCVDNLVSVDIVTADGRVRTASETENPDLFWAVRGAGSNFGVVTSFEFRLHAVGPLVAFAAPIYALEDAERVVPAWRDFMDAAPDEVSSQLFLWSVPAAEAFPAELHDRAIVAPAAVYAGPAEEGERVLRPLRELATPLLDLSATMPYAVLQSAFDALFPKGRLYYWKSLYLDDFDEETMAATIRYARDRPTPMTLLGLWHLGGGAASRVGAEATAFGRRDAPYLLSFDTTWEDPADDRALHRLDPSGLGRHAPLRSAAGST